MKMNNEELNTALYQKMEREQDKYRKWLVQCPPEEILSHAYEYALCGRGYRNRQPDRITEKTRM